MQRTTLTLFFEDRELSSETIASELHRLGDSTGDQDCLMRHALIEILTLRAELAEEQKIVDTLEGFGLQTLSSIFGVHSVVKMPSYQREWICWQRCKHTNLRAAVRQALTLRKPKGKSCN